MIDEKLFESEGALYWLATSKYFSELNKHNGGLYVKETYSLFSGDKYRNVMHHSPKLVSFNCTLNELPPCVFYNGIWIKTNTNGYELLNHLQSMLNVVVDGEILHWRFYDPHVLMSIDDELNIDNYNEFMQFIICMNVINNGKSKLYKRNFDIGVNYNKVHNKDEIWLNLDGKFLKNKSINILSYNIETFLWVNYKKQMDSILNSGIDFSHAIESCFREENILKALIIKTSSLLFELVEIDLDNSVLEPQDDIFESFVLAIRKLTYSLGVNNG